MDTLVSKLKFAASSRTVWTIVVLFLINGIGAIKGFIPVNWMPLVNAVLAVLAIYFRVNPQTTQ